MYYMKLTVTICHANNHIITEILTSCILAITHWLLSSPLLNSLGPLDQVEWLMNAQRE